MSNEGPLNYVKGLRNKAIEMSINLSSRLNSVATRLFRDKDEGSYWFELHRGVFFRPDDRRVYYGSAFDNMTLGQQRGYVANVLAGVFNRQAEQDPALKTALEGLNGLVREAYEFYTRLPSEVPILQKILKEKGLKPLGLPPLTFTPLGTQAIKIPQSV